MKLIKLMVVMLTLAGLVACGSTGGTKSDDVAVEDRSSDGTGGSDSYGGATTSGVSDYGSLSVESLSDPSSPLSQRVIYFAYDSDDVAEQDRALVAAHAAFLAANPDVKVSVEGHTDERGAREYNVALGERRGQTVRRMLEFQGVSPQQLSTVSYGEEKPSVEGHDESAWSMNRRVELVYVGY
ncbi:Tol-Pal system peptidoglycan-associated lipoprotein PAL [hydrothermal vent metagenome]|uniref:Tol-Pal system peptidoglycan-associated lipoprotein PAL n=1 Tax=hydrothermal vent metagenome TaxID=652676 RepID=A0A3B0YQK2_9ZZZZ